MSTPPDKSLKIIRTIGQGNFGRIYLVEHPEYGISVIKESISHSDKEYRISLNEAQILEHLTKYSEDCPWNIKQYGYKDLGGRGLVIYMEYFDGHDLSKVRLDFTEDKGFRAYDQWRVVAEELIKAVHCMHSLGVVHRDIKPANVMFDERSLKLVDFGFSCNPSQKAYAMEQCFGRAGTAYYMSPETIDSGGALDWEILLAADIWAVGQTLYTLAYGEPLYHRAQHMSKLKPMLLHTEPHMLFSDDTLNGHADKVNRIILLLLARDPEERIMNFRRLRTWIVSKY